MDFHPKKVTPGPKKVRKGTHSCRECRRRKVKCNYATPHNTACIMCERRGSLCISQWDMTLFDRAAPMKSLDRGDGTNSGRTRDLTGNTTTLNHARQAKLQPAQSPLRTAAAVSALGECVGTNRSSRSRDSEHGSTSPESPAHSAITDALVQSLPCNKDVEILEAKIGPVTAICYGSGYKLQDSGSAEKLKQQAPVKSLLDPEKHPTLLARQMLLFAAAVQDISPKELVPGLSEHHRVIMKRLAESAVKLVNLEDGLLGSLEGLENLIFELFYHMNNGNIRRAWITTRRAITGAQMLGLHRPDHYRFTLIKDNCDLRPEIMWATIVSMERMLSLLLGLPTSTSDITLEAQPPTADSSPSYSLSTLVGTMTMKIAKRNQVESARQALDMTTVIDREMIRAADHLPPSFWRTPSFAGLEKNSRKALSETQRGFGHMSYFTLVIQLHLPYLLGHHDTPQRAYSKISCINASKEILTREIELRTFNPVSASCRMGDFMALVAGMSMMLGHIISHGCNEAERFLAHQRLGDRAIVERVLECVDIMFDLQGDVLAARCATLLRKMLAIEEDIASHSKVRDASSQRDMMQIGRLAHCDILIMRVPYLGNVRISRDGVVTIPTASAQSSQDLSENAVTIGGIGSMSVSRSHVSTSNEDDTDVLNAILSACPTSEIFEEDSTIYHAPLVAEDWLTQSNSVFPDAAASLEEWAFQGVDTAFMEALMRGNSTLLADEQGSKA